MSATNLMDEIFGEGFSESAEAVREASEREAEAYARKPYTPSGVLKSWMMFKGIAGNLSVEASELTGIGWGRMAPPDRITVASDADHRHIYRLHLIDRTPDGDIGAWIYVPNVPESAPAPEVHIFND